MSGVASSPGTRVLICASAGEDLSRISQVLTDAALLCEACESISELITLAKAGIGVAVLTLDTLDHSSSEPFSQFLAEQSPGCEIPVVVLTPEAGNGSIPLGFLKSLGNILLVDRSARPETLITVVRSALRARQAQYEMHKLEAQLKSAQEDVRRINDDLQQFAYAASHDLQEPLRMISSYVQLLQKRYMGKLDKDAEEYISHASNGVNRMFRLIADLLSYSRIGTADSRLEQINCNDVMLWTKMNLSTLITESAAEITFDSLPEVAFDQQQLCLVFQNLIANSIKYRSTERPLIHVYAERSGDEWLFSVRDNGQGFDPKYADRIFGVFKRLHGRDIPGTGIGLAICKRIVEKHGGRMWAESEPGQGSTFRFSVPARETFAAAG